MVLACRMSEVALDRACKVFAGGCCGIARPLGPRQTGIEASFKPLWSFGLQPILRVPQEIFLIHEMDRFLPEN